MSFLGDYHTHTVFSHGKGTVEENVLAALSKGLREIAITDHGVCGYPENLHPDEVKDYLAAIEESRRLHPDIKIYSGVEANITSESGDLDITEAIEKDFDVIIFGWHSVRIPSKWKDIHGFWLPNVVKATKYSNKTMVRNTDAYLKAMDRYRISILGHLRRQVHIDLAPIGEMAAEKGILIELNSKNIELTVEDLQMLALKGCRFICSSDAHSPERVGDFSAADLFEMAGLDRSLIVNWNNIPVFKK
ncbi:MAG: PHP domain-containing protein [Clostridia bacterium]|nr:PHP domain-containing protein [Clostridia bacterium]